MISLDKNVLEVVMPYLQKLCVVKEAKDINVKTFNVITNKNEAKAMTKHISCDCNCKFNSTACNSNQKYKLKHVNVNLKIFISGKKL